MSKIIAPVPKDVVVDSRRNIIGAGLVVFFGEQGDDPIETAEDIYAKVDGVETSIGKFVEIKENGQFYYNDNPVSIFIQGSLNKYVSCGLYQKIGNKLSQIDYITSMIAFTAAQEVVVDLVQNIRAKAGYKRHFQTMKEAKNYQGYYLHQVVFISEVNDNKDSAGNFIVLDANSNIANNVNIFSISGVSYVLKRASGGFSDKSLLSVTANSREEAESAIQLLRQSNNHQATLVVNYNVDYRLVPEHGFFNTITGYHVKQNLLLPQGVDIFKKVIFKIKPGTIYGASIKNLQLDGNVTTNMSNVNIKNCIIGEINSINNITLENSVLKSESSEEILPYYLRSGATYSEWNNLPSSSPGDHNFKCINSKLKIANKEIFISLVNLKAKYNHTYNRISLSTNFHSHNSLVKFDNCTFKTKPANDDETIHNNFKGYYVDYNRDFTPGGESGRGFIATVFEGGSLDMYDCEIESAYSIPTAMRGVYNKNSAGASVSFRYMNVGLIVSNAIATTNECDIVYPKLRVRTMFSFSVPGSHSYSKFQYVLASYQGNVSVNSDYLIPFIMADSVDYTQGAPVGFIDQGFGLTANITKGSVTTYYGFFDSHQTESYDKCISIIDYKFYDVKYDQSEVDKMISFWNNIVYNKRRNVPYNLAYIPLPVYENKRIAQNASNTLSNGKTISGFLSVGDNPTDDPDGYETFPTD